MHRMTRLNPHPFLLVILLSWATWGISSPLLAQDDDELPNYRPGLRAEYTAGTVSIVRTDEDLAFGWGQESPDPRLPAGKFQAVWKGRLFSIVRGDYRLHLYTAGRVQLKLAGQEILQANAPQAAWVSAKGVKLEYGYHPLEIHFEQTADNAELALFWEGPQFQREPIPPRHLFHEPAQAADDEFAVGQLLTRALRCAACHALPHQPPPLAAPSLAKSGGQLDEQWLIHWLSTDEKSTPQVDNLPASPSALAVELRTTRRMPNWQLTREESKSVAAYLAALSQPVGKIRTEPDPPLPVDPQDKSKKKPKPPAPTAAAGQKMLQTVGCLACHSVNGLGRAGLFGGGDLSNIAAKRSPKFLADWLADPAALNAAHRMPVFRLSSVERASLSLYLQTLHPANQPAAFKPAAAKADDSQVKQGREIVKAFRCASCHELPEKTQPPALAAPLTEQSNWQAGCLQAADRAKHRPGFELPEKMAQAVQKYVSSLAGKRTERWPAQSSLDGPFVLAERNCLSCHARELAPGIAPLLTSVVAADAELAPQLPALAPPALNGVGDKLHSEWLQSAIASKQPLRPWLHIRMPRFQLADAEKNSLAAYFISHDRIPDLPPEPSPPFQETHLQVAGRRLVTADGFGCTSCHQVGDSVPHQVALNAHGTDLSLIGQRIRQPWFDRWVRNPARIVPRMEMPAIKLSVRGVLEDDINAQLNSVWHVLNVPGFNPPQPNPIRTVRATNLPDSHEPAQVLTDVLEVGKESFIKPFLIGLPNRHNVLLDFDHHQLAGWWIGDTARQRTRGKSWYWELGGSPVWPTSLSGADCGLIQQEKVILPSRKGQFTTEFDNYQFADGGLTLQHRLYFDQRELVVQQSYTSAVDNAQTGFRRTWQTSGLQAADVLRLWVTPAGKYQLASGGREVLAVDEQGKPGRFKVRLVEPAGGVFQLHPDDGRASVDLSKTSSRCVLEYLTNLPVDQYVVPALPTPPRVPLPLTVAPGFSAVELPLDEAMMPTGLAWQADGSLVLCSLKGDVRLLQDTDGDGLEDKDTVLADGLSAPYGLLTTPAGDVDVITKYALLRLNDRDANQRAQRLETLASGWGHTADYHDWAVGLVRQGADYLVALPCEQDNRSPEAAHLRGKLLRVSPPSAGEQSAGQKRWKLEEICGGLRFPMGLAVNEAGQIFASDNQGNYNPFNEINHLRPGLRYGFINSREKRPDFTPENTLPAINIPHPWTRSVNGLCFLTTPAPLKQKLGQALFDAFEGHLIGCEYNNRQLIRFSLEPIGDTFQGAAYPFTLEVDDKQPGLQGPVCCAVSPVGDLYIGNMRDSGWGAGKNTGSVVRMRKTGPLASGIAEVRATPVGFSITFTQPVDVSQANQTSNYSIEAYRRISTPAYGGNDVDRHPIKISRAQCAADGTRVDLELQNIQADFVYEIRLKDLTPNRVGLFPAEAYYTLHRKPSL